MQDKLIEIVTSKGDKLVVSLCCNHPYITNVLPEESKYLDIVEICIDRKDGDSPINIDMLGNLVQIIINELNEHPEVILYYFCDVNEHIPNMRESRKILPQEYRNRLFKSLFNRHYGLLPEPWRDFEIELIDPNTGISYYFHFLVRESQMSVVESLSKEVADNFSIIMNGK